jgi:hypothetical protein
MNEHIVCTECGSESLVASGVFEHGTWIHRLTCWTCRDCRSIVAIPEARDRVVDELSARRGSKTVTTSPARSEPGPA